MAAASADGVVDQQNQILLKLHRQAVSHPSPHKKMPPCDAGESQGGNFVGVEKKVGGGSEPLDNHEEKKGGDSHRMFAFVMRR